MFAERFARGGPQLQLRMPRAVEGLLGIDLVRPRADQLKRELVRLFAPIDL